MAAGELEPNASSRLAIQHLVSDKVRVPHACALDCHGRRNKYLAGYLVIAGRHPNGLALLLGLGDALPEGVRGVHLAVSIRPKIEDAQRIRRSSQRSGNRSEEHTSELQSPCNLVCRRLL